MKITLKELKRIIKEKGEDDTNIMPTRRGDTNIDYNATTFVKNRAQPPRSSSAPRPTDPYDLEDFVHLMLKEVDNLSKKALYATKSLQPSHKNVILEYIDELETHLQSAIEKEDLNSFYRIKNMAEELTKEFVRLGKKDEQFKELAFIADRLKTNTFQAMKYVRD